MSRFSPAAVMVSFARKVKHSIQSWRKRKQNSVWDDSSDQLFIDHLEARVMLDGDTHLEEFRDDTSFHHLPAEIGAALSSYFDPRSAAGPTEIWRPTLPSDFQHDPDVNGQENDRIDFDQQLGSGLQTVTPGTDWATYEVDPNGPIGTWSDVKISSVKMDNNNYLLVGWFAEITRSINLSSSPSGGFGGGPGGPSGESNTPTETVKTDYRIVVTQVGSSRAAKLATKSRNINISGSNRYVEISLEHKFDYYKQDFGGFKVTTDFDTDVRFEWIGSFTETEAEERSGGTSSTEPLGETVTNYQYDISGTADRDGEQLIEGTAQIGPGNIGSARYELSGETFGDYSLSSKTKVLSTYTREDYQEGTDNQGTQIVLDVKDNYTANGDSYFTYTGNFDVTPDAKGNSSKSGTISTTLRGGAESSDKGTTTLTYNSVKAFDASQASEEQQENDGGGDTEDRGDGEDEEVKINRLIRKNHYKNVSTPNLDTTAEFEEKVTINYKDGEQDVTTFRSDGWTSYVSTGSTSTTTDRYDYLKETDEQFGISTESSIRSVTSSGEWVESFDANLTYTPNSAGEFVITGQTNSRKDTLSGSLSKSAAYILVAAAASAALRDENKEAEGSILPVNVRQFTTKLHNDAGGGRTATLGNSQDQSNENQNDSDPPSDKDLLIAYSVSSDKSSSRSTIVYQPGFTSRKVDYLSADKGRITSDKDQKWTITNESGQDDYLTKSWAVAGDYDAEDGSVITNTTSQSDKWSYGSTSGKSQHHLVELVDQVKVEVPDEGGSGGSGTSNSTSSSVGGSGQDTSENDIPTETQITTDGNSYSEVRQTGYRLDRVTTTASSSKAHFDKETSDGFNHHNSTSSYFNTVTTTETSPDQFSSTQKTYAGSVLESTASENRQEKITTVSTDTGTTFTDWSGTGKRSGKSTTEIQYGVLKDDNQGDGSSSSDDTLPTDGGITIANPTTEKEIIEGSSDLSSGGSSSVEIDRKVTTAQERIQNTNSSSGGTSGPGSAGDGSESGGVDPNQSYSYQSKFHRYTISGKDDVTTNSSSWSLEDNRNWTYTFTSDSTPGPVTDQDNNDEKRNTPPNAYSSTFYKQRFGGPEDSGDLYLSSVNLTDSVKYDNNGIHSVTNGSVTSDRILDTDIEVPTEDGQLSTYWSQVDLDGYRYDTNKKITKGKVLEASDQDSVTDIYENYGTTLNYRPYEEPAEDSEENAGNLFDQYFGVTAEEKGTGRLTTISESSGESSSEFEISEKHRKTDTFTETNFGEDYGAGKSNGGWTAHTESAGHSEKYKEKATVVTQYNDDGSFTVTSEIDAKEADNTSTQFRKTNGGHLYFYQSTNADGDLETTKRNGSYLSSASTETKYSEGGKFTYEFNKDGDLIGASGTQFQNQVSKGDSGATDNAYVGKSVEKTGPFTLADIAPEIQAKVSSEFHGGGSRTGKVVYEVEATEGLVAGEHYNGEMRIETTTGYDSEKKEVTYDEVKTYQNRIEGDAEHTTTSTHLYKALDAIGAEPTDELKTNESYNYNITADNFDNYDFLGFNKLGYGTIGYKGSTIDVDLSAAYTTIANIVGNRTGESTNASNLTTENSNSNYQISSYQQAKQQKEKDEGYDPNLDPNPGAGLSDGKNGPLSIPNRLAKKTKPPATNSVWVTNVLGFLNGLLGPRVKTEDFNFEHAMAIAGGIKKERIVNNPEIFLGPSTRTEDLEKELKNGQFSEKFGNAVSAVILMRAPSSPSTGKPILLPKPAISQAWRPVVLANGTIALVPAVRVGANGTIVVPVSQITQTSLVPHILAMSGGGPENPQNSAPRGSLFSSMFGKTPKQVLKAKPKTWKKVAADGNGWKLVDENGVERIRFMRPDKKGKFHHNTTGYWRIQDEAGNFLDEFGNIVSRTDPNFHIKTHIPYTGT